MTFLRAHAHIATGPIQSIASAAGELRLHLTAWHKKARRCPYRPSTRFEDTVQVEHALKRRSGTVRVRIVFSARASTRHAAVLCGESRVHPDLATHMNQDNNQPSRGQPKEAVQTQRNQTKLRRLRLCNCLRHRSHSSASMNSTTARSRRQSRRRHAYICCLHCAILLTSLPYAVFAAPTATH